MDPELKATLTTAIAASGVGLSLSLPAVMVLSVMGSTEVRWPFRGEQFAGTALGIGVLAGLAAGGIVSLVTGRRLAWIGLSAGVGSQVGPWLLLWRGSGSVAAIVTTSLLGALACGALHLQLARARRRLRGAMHH